MAPVSVRLLGSNNALGSRETGFTGNFVSFQERAKENAANIYQTAEFTEYLAEDVSYLQCDVNYKFFMVTTELGALAPVQKEMLAIQNGNWKGIQERFGIFQHNIQVLHDCDRQSISRQQINFNCHTNFPLVAIFFANNKIYRSYLHTY